MNDEARAASCCVNLWQCLGNLCEQDAVAGKIMQLTSLELCKL